MLEGTLECQVTDPVSGQSKTATIHGGEVGNFYVYTQAQGGEYCGITTEKFSESDINGFVLTELASNSAIRQIKDGRVSTLVIRDPSRLEDQYPVSPAGLLIQGKTLYVCDSFSGKILVLTLR